MSNKKIHPLLAFSAVVNTFHCFQVCESIDMLRDGSFGCLAKDLDLQVWANYYRNENDFGTRFWRSEIKSSSSVRDLEAISQCFILHAVGSDTN